MRRAVIFIAATLLGCSPKAPERCPSIERLAGRDPIADARAALAKGDRHLLSLGGFVGVVPGVPDDVSEEALKNAVEIEGTSDTTTDACRRIYRVAETYAAKYNEAILGTHK
jgi:hypothetical protein